MLDLFERHLTVFNEIEEAAKGVLNAVSAKEKQAPFWNYVRAEAKARFLFGPEIVALLAKHRSDIAAIMAFSNISFEHPEYATLIDRMQAAEQNLAVFIQNSAEPFAPYMRMDQKMPSLWWPNFQRR